VTLLGHTTGITFFGVDCRGEDWKHGLASIICDSTARDASAKMPWHGHIPKRSQERAQTAPILVDAAGAAIALCLSKRSFHRLRKRMDFPTNATVVLGPRCVRYRLEALQAFAASLASEPQREPEQLRRSRRIRTTR
jgi:hypothetical protein